MAISLTWVGLRQYCLSPHCHQNLIPGLLKPIYMSNTPVGHGSFLSLQAWKLDFYFLLISITWNFFLTWYIWKIIMLIVFYSPFLCVWSKRGVSVT